MDGWMGRVDVWMDGWVGWMCGWMGGREGGWYEQEEQKSHKLTISCHSQLYLIWYQILILLH